MPLVTPHPEAVFLFTRAECHNIDVPTHHAEVLLSLESWRAGLRSGLLT